MSRQEMIDALGELGFDTSKLTDSVPDEVLAEMLANLQPAEEQPEETPPPDAAMADEDIPGAQDQGGEPPAEDGMGRDEMIAALVQAGHSEEELQGMSDEDLAALFEQASQEEQPAEQPVAQMSEQQVVIHRFSESDMDTIVSRVTKELTANLAPIRQQVAELDGNAKKANVTKFCEAMVQEGRLLPANFTKTVDRLLRANHQRKISHFSEGKRVATTELDLQMDEIRKSPVVLSFSERMKQPVGTTDGEVAKVESHYEAFSEKYTKIGISKEKLAKGFQSARKANPKLTANEYCSGL